MIPCLGGFCSERDRCAHYYSESIIPPAERLCAPGESEPVYFMQIAEKRKLKIIEVLH